jgi:hypothetical protein
MKNISIWLVPLAVVFSLCSRGGKSVLASPVPDTRPSPEEAMRLVRQINTAEATLFAKDGGHRYASLSELSPLPRRKTTSRHP